MLDHGAYGTAFKQRFEVILNIVHVEAEATSGEAIDHHFEVLDTLILQRKGVFRPLYVLQASDNAFGQIVEYGEVRAVDFDGQIAAYASQHFGDAHVDRLGK